MSIIELLKQRRSIRLFTGEEICSADKENILRAGLLAPTGMGRRHIELVSIEDKQKIEHLASFKAHGTRPLQTATWAVAVLGDSTIAQTWVEDASLCAILMQLEVAVRGLGSTWVQLDKRETAEGQSSDAALRDFLGYPEDKKVLCILAIGHPDEEKEPRGEDFVDFAKVHHEQY